MTSLPESTAPIEAHDLPAARLARRTIPQSLTTRYQDVQFLGEGGMGTVYRAVDPRLGRVVALKFLKEADSENIHRFLDEARLQARLKHEHICQIYEAGEVDGEPYISMQFIDGRPLSRVRDKLSLEQLMNLMKEVCLAVHEAHRTGLIHRDIKPSNILVEDRDDGTKKPWVMDFGLARDVNVEGQTQSGAVVGTIAYMSPEQANGNVRSLDRRSDVYSLGATMYEMIAGHPPFVAEHPWKLLMMVGYEDAPTLHKVQKGVPEDLETIVMKCLEREPARRYDSARTLADDLQRYLDGEPILGKRSSLGYILYKKARKNKWVTALLFVLLVASSGFVGVWVRAQRQAIQRETLARELGESVKEIELFMRAAYELPLHDVERERNEVRRRLGEFENRLATAGKTDAGPLHYALGRGHLALGDSLLAKEHLEKAIAAGYSSPDLEYALGRAMGEIFRRAVEEAKHITNKDEQKKKIAELETRLRDPALGHLRSATGARIESPLYAEGLVALYEGKNEEAIKKAREAFAKAPWLYEPKKLEGDALFAEGSKYRHDAAFDYEKMKTYFAPAAEAYKLAAEMGSSDPEVYRAECELWEKTANSTSALGKDPENDFNAADAACMRAVQSSSTDAAARVQRALALHYRFFWTKSTGKDVAKVQAAALEAVDEAVRVRPNDPMALYARASTFHVRVMIQVAEGKPLSVREAVDAFQRVLEVEPRFTWALSELGQTYLTQAQVDRLHGKDPREALLNARKQFEQAREVDASFSVVVYLSIRALCIQLGYETEHGIDAKSTIAALDRALEQLDALKLGGWYPVFWKARAMRLQAAYDAAVGNDPSVRVEQGLTIIRDFLKSGDDTRFLQREFIELRLIAAGYALRTNAPPVNLDQERETLRKGLEATPNDIDIDDAELLGRVDLWTMRAFFRDPAKSKFDLDKVFTFLVPLLRHEIDDPRGYEVLAELYAEKCEWLQAHGKDASVDIDAGLAMVDKVLAIDSHHANTLVCKGRLLAAAARNAPETSRAELREKAKSAFATALRENPRLEREHWEETISTKSGQ